MNAHMSHTYIIINSMLNIALSHLTNNVTTSMYMYHASFKPNQSSTFIKTHDNNITMNNIHLHHHSSKHMITIFTTNNIHLHNKQKQSHYNKTHHHTYSIMQTKI